jgi:Tol biopolymer transport system component
MSPSIRVLVVAAVIHSNGVAQQVVRANVDSSGAEATDWSRWPTLSGNGRYVSFLSASPNLVAGDANGDCDVFVYDRHAGTTDCVSVDPNGIPGNDASGQWGGDPASMSFDGRYVAFASWATNLLAGRTTLVGGIYLRDRQSGTTELVSVDSNGAQGNGNCDFATMSDDGSIVVFDSDASDLVANDTNQKFDIFVHDRTTGVTERISVDSSGAEANGDSFGPLVSTDGQVVVFSSNATNLVAGDGNGAWDVFVHDRRSGTTTRISVDSSGTEATGASAATAFSRDGSTVAFRSSAANLVAGDGNGVIDLFVHEFASGVTERVSVDSFGNEGDGQSSWAALSSDGRKVAFDSGATNLVVGDTNAQWDVFLHDRTTGTTVLRSLDPSGIQGDDGSSFPTISADGGSIAFESEADNLVPGDSNGIGDVFVRDDHVAAWTNYGSGFAGTNGVPLISAQQDPVLGTSLTVDVGNSYGQPTFGLLLVGFTRADFPTGFGGEVLLVPALLVPISFSYGADSFSCTVPTDVTLAGTTLDVQAVESDPGSAHGVSFTPGLELSFGF